MKKGSDAAAKDKKVTLAVLILSALFINFL